MSTDKRIRGLPCHQLDAIWPPSQQLWPVGRLATCALREQKRFLRALRAAEPRAREYFRHARWSGDSGILIVRCPRCRRRALSYKPGDICRWYCMPNETRITREWKRARNEDSLRVPTSTRHGCTLRFNDLDRTPLAGFPHVPMAEVLLLLAYSGCDVAAPLAVREDVREALVALESAHKPAPLRLRQRLTIYARAFVGEVIRERFASQCDPRALQAIQAAETRARTWQAAQRIARDAQVARIQHRYHRLRERLQHQYRLRHEQLLNKKRAAMEIVKRRF